METDAKRKGRRPFAVAVVVLALLAILSGLMVWMQMPHRYYVRPPNDRAKREALAARVAEELAGWHRVVENTEWGPGAAADADRMYPLDRLAIVSAIQKFYLETGELPADIKNLLDAELVSDSSLSKRYNLVLKDGKWELRMSSGFRIAVGN